MSDHKPVTAEELASVDAQAGAAMASAERIDLNLEGFDDCTEVGDMARVQAVIELAPRLARDLADARHDLDTERKASAMLADRMLDLGRELEALRAAVRAHRAAHEAGEGETVALVRLYQLAGLT